MLMRIVCWSQIHTKIAGSSSDERDPSRSVQPGLKCLPVLAPEMKAPLYHGRWHCRGEFHCGSESIARSLSRWRDDVALRQTDRGEESGTELFISRAATKARQPKRVTDSGVRCLPPTSWLVTVAPRRATKTGLVRGDYN